MITKQQIAEIANTINNHSYIIDDWLVSTLDEEFKNSNYSERKNVDALALEKYLLVQGKINVLPKIETEKFQWRHDWALTPDVLIDLKRKPGYSKNISLSGIEKMRASAEMQPPQLTHIVAYTQNIEHNYKIGQVLTFKFEGILPVKEVFSSPALQKKSPKFFLFPINEMNTEILSYN